MTSAAGKFATPRTVPLGASAKDYLTAANLHQVTTTSLADIAGIALTLRAGSLYRFSLEAAVSVAGATSQLGIGMAFSGTTVAPQTTPQLIVFSGLGMVATQALNTAIAEGTRAIGLNGLRAYGIINPTTAGTFKLQAQRSGSATVYICYTLEVVEI